MTDVDETEKKAKIHLKNEKHEAMIFGVKVLPENLEGVLADPAYGPEVYCTCGHKGFYKEKHEKR